MTTTQELSTDGGDPRLQAFIGKTAIAGLYRFYQGNPVDRTQVFGQIAAVEDGKLVIETANRRKYFPIMYEALVPAPRGKYVLDSTREVAVNPDFLISLRVDLADNLPDSQWTANTAPHFDSIVGKEWEFEYAYDRGYQKALIEARGAELVGKTILVGISADGKNSQVFGEVVRVSMAEGVAIKPKDGAEFTLPPDISLLQAPPPGEYVLESTQEVIVDPDLMTIWDKTTRKDG
jgi:hypothetical protein